MYKQIKWILFIILLVIISGAFLLYKNRLKYDYIPSVVDINDGLTDIELKEQIGQMIMIGFRGVEVTEDSEIIRIIKEIGIGGVVLFDYDIPSNTYPRNIIDYEQTKKLISDIQGYSKIPLFVAIDAEGGNVNRLKSKYGFISIMSAKTIGQDKTLQTVDVESERLSLELKDLGFNMNLAPVLDVDINPNNPIIGSIGRSFSSDPSEVVDQVEVFIQNHLNNNIITVGKHFPGHGSSTEDSHKGVVDITNTYEKEELLPYKEINEGGLLKVVMVAHVINRNIDKNYPATLSKYFIQDILKDDIGFEGLVISDDMQMSAIINNYKLNDSIIMAINAGVDVISVMNNSVSGYDSELAYKVLDLIFDAVRDGVISEERIIESYVKIIDLKQEFKIIKLENSDVRN